MSMWAFPVLLCACLQGPAAHERILYNAKIFTAEPPHPYAEAVAIRGDKIVAVGNRVEVWRAVANGAESIDLKGKFLMPGLIDSHCHAVSGGLSLISATVGDSVRSVAQLAAFAAAAKQSGRGMQGDILVVRGVPLEFWSKNNELNRRFNSAPYTDQPVLLKVMDGHTAWANQALLQRAGINSQLIRSLDTLGRGYYGIGPDLEPNGFLVDAAMDKVNDVVPEPSSEQMLAAGRAAVQHMHELGITAWLDPRASEAILSIYRKLAGSRSRW